MDFIGLYYPYIHFRDDSWLKASALYWDKINRIVPDEMMGLTDDSPTVKLLKDELGFIDDIPPDDYQTMIVSDVFAKVVESHSEELQKKFDISKKNSWPANATRLRGAYREQVPAGFDHRVAYVQRAKMSEALSDLLVRLHLAEHLPSFEFKKDWYGMHPRLAGVYMTALVQVIAKDGRMYPVPESDEDQIAIVELSLEEMARVLLADSNDEFEPKYKSEQNLTREDLKKRYVELAFPVVIPKGLDHVDAREIVKLRKDSSYTDTFRAFQQKLNEIASEAWVAELNQITNQASRNSHIQNQVQIELLEPYRKMKAQVDGMNNGSVSTVMSVLVQLAMVATTGGLAVASTALKMIPSIAKEKEAANKEIAESPAAFLLYLEENLTPSNALARTRRRLRKFTYGV